MKVPLPKPTRNLPYGAALALDRQPAVRSDVNVGADAKRWLRDKLGDAVAGIIGLEHGAETTNADPGLVFVPCGKHLCLCAEGQGSEEKRKEDSN